MSAFALLTRLLGGVTGRCEATAQRQHVAIAAYLRGHMDVCFYRRMHVIALASREGGAGKTTLASHLAVEAEKAGSGPIAVVDTDPQGGLAGWWNGRDAALAQRSPRGRWHD